MAKRPAKERLPAAAYTAASDSPGGDLITPAYCAASACICQTGGLVLVCRNAVGGNARPQSADALARDTHAVGYELHGLLAALRSADTRIRPILAEVRRAVGDSRGELFRLGATRNTTALETALDGCWELFKVAASPSLRDILNSAHHNLEPTKPLPRALADDIVSALRRHWSTEVLPAWRRLPDPSDDINDLDVRLWQEWDNTHERLIGGPVSASKRSGLIPYPTWAWQNLDVEPGTSAALPGPSAPTSWQSGPPPARSAFESYYYEAHLFKSWLDRVAAFFSPPGPSPQLRAIVLNEIDRRAMQRSLESQAGRVRALAETAGTTFGQRVRDAVTTVEAAFVAVLPTTLQGQDHPDYIQAEGVARTALEVCQGMLVAIGDGLARAAKVADGVEEHWFPAPWYGQHTRQDLYPDLLRIAAGRGLIKGRKRGRRWWYELGSVCAQYYQYRLKLEAAAAPERKRTEPNEGEHLKK